MTDTNETPKLTKLSATINVSNDMVDMLDIEVFPRRGHMIEREWTADEKAAYADLAARWESAKTEWEAVQSIAEETGWGSALRGYEYDEATLRPLPDMHTEWVWDEPVETWRARVNANRKHHTETGEWLEAPRPTLMEQAMRMTFWGKQKDETEK